MHSLNLTNTVWPHAFHADSTRSFWPSTSDHSPLAGGVKLANSQALVIAPRPERGALRYLCITYWFGGTTLGCKTKIKKLAINYFSRGHSELVSHSWKPPGERERKKSTKLPGHVMDSGILIFLSEQQKKKKGLCSQHFPLSSDRAATFLSTPSKVTACSAEASTCQMYIVAFAVSIEAPVFQ